VTWLRDLPPLLRYAIEGAVLVGVVGAVAGLVIGLIVNAATAPFAVVEVGLPSAALGALVGLAIGGAVDMARRAKKSRR
jgi:hypothetical protein